MRIVADEKMTGLDELIRPLGELITAPGRDIGPALLVDAEALLVRSITPVTADLLTNSPVRFVGTATSGLDHVDQEFLASRGITLAAAPGSNANAVVDYVLAALATMIGGGHLDRAELSVGIIGLGQVGSRLQQRLAALGIATALCDPPLAAQLQHDQAAALVSLDEVLRCQVVSLHVPLLQSGAHPTAPLLDYSALAAMGPDRVLVNTSRGGVVDEDAWLELHAQGQAPQLISDVWCHEPSVNGALVQAAYLATPHIAGYSERAKRQATRMLADALVRYRQGLSHRTEADPVAIAVTAMSADSGAWHPEHWQSLAAVLPLPELSLRFKKAVAEAGRAGLSAGVFDGFRSDLRSRREFGEQVIATADLSDQVAFFRAAGFADAQQQN